MGRGVKKINKTKSTENIFAFLGEKLEKRGEGGNFAAGEKWILWRIYIPEGLSFLLKTVSVKNYTLLMLIDNKNLGRYL